MGDEIIVMCLIILILTGEFILWTSQIWGKWTISLIQASLLVSQTLFVRKGG